MPRSPQMELLGAKRARIAAAIGPCISQANYEVGPEFHARFVAADHGQCAVFREGTACHHYRFDLEAYVVHRLGKAGIDRNRAASACTYAREADFFSFRRATHRGEKDYGRQISAIVLTL